MKKLLFVLTILLIVSCSNPFYALPIDQTCPDPPSEAGACIKMAIGEPETIRTESEETYEAKVDRDGEKYKITIKHPDYPYPLYFDDSNADTPIAFTIHVGRIYIQRQENRFFLRFPRMWKIVQ